MGLLVTAERFMQHYNQHAGDLPPSYYHNTKLVVHGQIPESGQMAYFLAYGSVFSEQSPWGRVVYHIPQAHREDANAHLRAILPYFKYGVNLRRGRGGKVLGERVTVWGDHRDERGRPIVEAITGHLGQVERINYTRRGIVPRPDELPDIKGEILYLRQRNRVSEPVLI